MNPEQQKLAGAKRPSCEIHGGTFCCATLKMMWDKVGEKCLESWNSGGLIRVGTPESSKEYNLLCIESAMSLIASLT